MRDHEENKAKGKGPPGACDLFREQLEQALLAQRNLHSLRALGWQEHLRSCHACGELLASEQALELLLASLPEVALSADLTERVLARLAADRSTHAGQGSGGEGAAEAALDRLLDRAMGHEVLSLPPPRLAAGVLADLEPERARATELISLSHRWAWVAAALGLIALGLWFLDPGENGTLDQPEESTDVAGLGTEPEGDLDVDPDLLASLEVLEHWELLLSEDVDLLLGGVGSMGDLAAGTELFSESFGESSLEGSGANER